MNIDFDELATRWDHQRPDLDVKVITISTITKRLGDMLELETRSVSQSVANLGAGDARILFALRRNGPDAEMRPTDLFRSLLITSGAVTKQVDRLVRRKLVERRPDPNYKRGRLIALTDAGKEVADQLMTAMFASQSRMGAALADLSKEEKDAGLRFLRTMLAKLEAAGLTLPDE